MNQVAVDPFVIFETPQKDEEAEATSWAERLWLGLFDAGIALGLLFFVVSAI